MKPNDIEFLMYAMNSLNSQDMEVVNAFRNSKDNVQRLSDLVGLYGNELFKAIDHIKMGKDLADQTLAELAFEQYEFDLFDSELKLTVENYDIVKQAFIQGFTRGWKDKQGGKS
jgi:phage-related tail protein